MADATSLVDYYRDTHASRVYGTSSVKYLRFLRPEIRVLKPGSILDFGCGQSMFLDCLEPGFPIERLRYDPAIPAYDTLPDGKADLLINIDVLEHIEEQDLDAILATMRGACHDAIIIIDMKPAKHKLPDGRNAHVSLHDRAWWQAKLSQHFDHLEPIATPRRSRAGFRTWSRTPAQTTQYRLLRAKETARYYARRVMGTHKSHWKVSTTGTSTGTDGSP